MLFFILRPSAACIEKQKEAFRSQIRIALELELPLVIHCRDAEEDCWDIMVEVRLHLHTSNISTRNWSFPTGDFITVKLFLGFCNIMKEVIGT